MILILVLGVLGLMAVIGVTFATFTGQSRSAARSFAQSKIRPQGEELMDFALAQLICDTNDVRSAIRGHSLARDMYGNDAFANGFVEYRGDRLQMAPGNDPFFYVVQATQVAAGSPLYNLETNIPEGDPLFYGYDFNRWTVKIVYRGTPAAGTRVINQALEVVNDSGFVPGGTGSRVLTVVIRPEDAAARIVNPSYPGGLTTVSPAGLIVANLGNNLGTDYRFTLDGRWLRAFNGPGRTTAPNTNLNPNNGLPMLSEAKYGNFRYNNDGPGSRGMDEDYDAVDLENWFLAMQSADGQVVIPSFHRPAAIRYEPNNTDPAAINDMNDWSNAVDTSLDPMAMRKKLARILRPRAADGNDAMTFPDLIPGAADGKISYDVDNDGDGVADSVWVDLGYPARRNAQGNLYKPLFAFMVIGLNGRMPLNTAGNMAARGGLSGDEPESAHAAHLGNSVSEIDPSYGLQNAYATGYGQYDNAAVDVRLTQLRNILAGTRPQADPYNPDLTGVINGDANWVAMGTRDYFLPNGQVDLGDVDINGLNPPAAAVVRRTPAVPGRWGEADSVPGGDYIPLGAAYANEVRPGYSISYTDASSGTHRPLDAADDNYNTFDVYPVPAATGRVGEVGDADYYDASGSLAFAVERIRRFVTPVDFNGSGRVARFNARGPAERGGDLWGRVEYRGYFRPPGLPGQINPATDEVYHDFVAGDPYPNQRPVGVKVANREAHNNNILHGFESHLLPNTRGTPQRSGGMLAYKSTTDLTPGIPTQVPTYDGNINTGVQYNLTTPSDDGNGDTTIPNFRSRSDGLNEADEMNLYSPNPLVDEPFGFADLEWLYRSHDVDGASLSSRLEKLAPISFTNIHDGLRRRRLYSIDTWESNAFAWANDNPMGAFGLLPDSSGAATRGGNSRFAPAANASMVGTTYAPGLAQRGRKINLNVPLPVSTDPREPIRQKWISDAYQFMKTVLPPRAIDTPEELAQLGQYLVNVIDFRDPDCAMTIWDNPDVFFIPVGKNGKTPVNTHPELSFTQPSAACPPLRHYGVEYNPVAINEVLAFSYGRRNGAVGNGLPTGRFFVELVNTLSAPDGSPDDENNGSVINLSGYGHDPAGDLTKPYLMGSWDLVFSDDAVGSRPDPFTGQLQQGAKVYGVTPLGGDSLTSKVGAGTSPVTEGALLRALPRGTSANPPLAVFGFDHPAGATEEGKSEHGTGGATSTWSSFLGASSTATLYLMNTARDPFNGAAVLPADPDPDAAIGFDGILPRDIDGKPVTSFTGSQIPRAAGSGAYYWVHLRRPANPMRPASASNPMVVVDSMRFPYVDVGGSAETTGSPSPAGDPNKVDKVTQAAGDLYSYQRMQPYRGGQAVPWDPTAAGATDPRYGFTEQVAASTKQLGQMHVFFGDNTTQRDDSASANGQVTRQFIYNSLGEGNDETSNEFWDWFPFHDRDFTSPYELTLVPGCGPGMLTKQFAEFAPTAASEPGFKEAAKGALTTSHGAIVQKPGDPGGDVANTRAAKPFLFRGEPFEPHSFPYLIDKFFYTAANPPVVSSPLLPTDDLLYISDSSDPDFEKGTVGGYAADGWFKMFEFFEVPSQSAGAVGMVQDGTNFDWARQDVRPGMLNLNLIIDEEVFLGLLGKHNSTYDEQLLDATPIPTVAALNAALGLSLTEYTGGAWPPAGAPLPNGYPPVPMIVTATTANGSPAFVHPMNNVGSVLMDPTGTPLSNTMKAAFAQFLWARHGGSGFLYGFGEGATGQNYSIEPVGRTEPYSGIPMERPFRSPSYPDVDHGPMRPAALPPSPFTDPPSTLANTADPGVRNQARFGGYERVSWGGSTETTPVLPPPIPARRLFQPADARDVAPSVSNASLFGNPYVNNIRPVNAPDPADPTKPSNPTIGGLPGVALDGGVYGERGTNLFNPRAKLGNEGGKSMAQHPYFRGEQMQRILNLTTTRTHQYAVWITIGFFEVKREGDIAMIGHPLYPTAAFDLMGPEVGASTGQNVRYRSFFVVDRLKLTGFDPDSVGAFRPAVVYRRTIQ